MSKADEIQFISFKQFIYTINIRNCYLLNGKEINDNEIVRLFYKSNGIVGKDNYIDLGWYDYFNKDSVWKILEETLNQNILDSIVTDFRYDIDYNCIVVYLSNKNEIKETLQEYAN